MRQVSIEEFVRLQRMLKEEFQPYSDRNCPDIRERLIGQGMFQDYERVKEVDLSTLPVGSEIYFFGPQAPAYYTLKIVEVGRVRAWRDVDANALEGPIKRICAQNGKQECMIEEGVLRVMDIFWMPYFSYNTDENPEAKPKEVVNPIDLYVGTCMNIFLKRAEK